MSRLVFQGAQVFDGTGASPAPADLVIENGRIVDVGHGLDGDQAVDVTGRTLFPGFFDCHVHVMASHFDLWREINTPYSYRYFDGARNLGQTLRGGITFVRDAAGADLGVKQAREDGLIVGPRMHLSLTMVSQTGGHNDDWLVSGVRAPIDPVTPGNPSGVVDGPDEMRRKVRELHRMGADVIKVATSGGVLSPRDDPRHAHFRPVELDVLVEEATAAGMFVMAHAQARDGIINAVRAGIRSIEHGIFLDDEGIDLMLERGTWLVPTLGAAQAVVTAGESGTSLSPGVLEKARSVVEVHRAAVRRAIEAGVRIAMGTDAPLTPHGQNLREVGYLVDAGMAPAAALEAATRSAAELLGVERDLGTLEPGKLADLVVVGGDPFETHTLHERIEGVWLAGVRAI
jgi:imidazolonepropionase-like amidohydrolase